MATTVGSQGIPVNTGSPETTAAVNTFIAAQGWTNQNLVPVNPESIRDGSVTYTDNSTGTLVTIVGEEFQKPVFKISDLNQGRTDDILIGTGTNTTVIGSTGGNKITITDDSSNTIRGRDGDDVITNLGSGGGVFRGGAGSDTITGGSGSETIRGGDGRDVLMGGGGSDTLYGGQGDDAIAGGEGNDFMYGGAGADVLTGGAGNDAMTGGAGRDTFVFGSEQTGVDVITDFHKGDTLNLLGKQDAGIGHTVTQVGSNTVLTFTDGSTVVLEKVDSTKLHEDPDHDGYFVI